MQLGKCAMMFKMHIIFIPDVIALTVAQIPSQSYCHHYHRCYSHFLDYCLYICHHCLQYNGFINTQETENLLV